MQAEGRVFYWPWVAANGVAEAVGLGGVFVLGFVLAPSVESRSGTTAVVGLALAAIATATVLEGGIVGLAQERALRRHPAMTLRPGAWTIATMIGAGVAWTIGMLPSTIIALRDDMGASSMEEPGTLIRYFFGVLLGLVAGPILGFAQAVVLRRLTSRALVWLWANALAWAVGMPLIFAGMEVVPWDTWPTAVIGAVLVCGLAGLAVGAIHGAILIRILPQT